MRLPAAAAWLSLMAAGPGTAANTPAYTGSGQCAACHAVIAATYRQTGMGRSFTPAAADLPGLDASGKARFYHQASRQWYTVLRRDGAAYVRRHQIGFDGKETNVLEARAEYVIGSGNHAASLLHRATDGRLLQLPVAWYSETRTWGMAPGYDRAGHAGFRRGIDAECMFCHNAYPLQPVREIPWTIPAFPSELPRGIDCERCHGPGSEHVRLAGAGGAVSGVRAAILNPARLSAERQLEVCMQCHLQATNQALPFAVRRPDRPVFSYDPREPLSSYMLLFDRSRPREESFEVNHAAYRLRQSACFRGSAGRMVCTTCHNPHDVPRGDAAARHYAEACRACHASLQPGHPPQADCASCHMPKRRTEDAVHVVMTDHWIARRPPAGDPLQAREESHEQPYAGEVALLYPARPLRKEDELEMAVAQVRDGANLMAGLARLASAIGRHRPAGPAFRFELAEAYRKTGRAAEAVREYEAVLERSPDLAPAWVGWGQALVMAGQASRALDRLGAVLPRIGPSAPLFNLVGSLRQQSGDDAAAEAAFRQAMAARPELPEPYLNLGVTLARQGRLRTAEEAFREALRQAPELSAAHNNLAYLLTAMRRNAEAEHHFEEAIRLEPDYWFAHLSYARLLASTGRREKADEHFRRAAKSPDPALRREALSALGGDPRR